MSTAAETADSPHIDRESLKLVVPSVTASNGWRADELSTIDGCGEVDIATRRSDGTLRAARIVWIVRHGNAVYVRAARLDETLDLRTRLIVQLAAILAAGGLAEFRVVAAAAVANGGVSPVELKEIVYQSVAYVGMARAFDYLHAVNDVLTEAGVELPLPGQSASTPQTRLEHGQAVQGRIIGGDAVATRLTDTPPDEVHFQCYLAASCFGDTVGRGGIDLEVRELLTFSMLVLGGADAQVRGHVNGNLRVGNTRAGLLAVLTVLAPFIGYPLTLNGLAALNDITGS